jgi:hypothetical protein
MNNRESISLTQRAGQKRKRERIAAQQESENRDRDNQPEVILGSEDEEIEIPS